MHSSVPRRTCMLGSASQLPFLDMICQTLLLPAPVLDLVSLRPATWQSPCSEALYHLRGAVAKTRWLLESALLRAFTPLNVEVLKFQFLQSPWSHPCIQCHLVPPLAISASAGTLSALSSAISWF